MIKYISFGSVDRRYLICGVLRPKGAFQAPTSLRKANDEPVNAIFTSPVLISKTTSYLRPLSDVKIYNL